MSIESINSSSCYAVTTDQTEASSPSKQSSSWGIIDAVSNCWNGVKDYIASYWSSPTPSTAPTEPKTMDISSFGKYIDDRSWQLAYVTEEDVNPLNFGYILTGSTADNYSELFELTIGKTYSSTIESSIDHIHELKKQDASHCDYIIHEQTPSSCIYELWIYDKPRADQTLSENATKWLHYHSLSRIVQQGTTAIIISYQTRDMETPLMPKWEPILNKFNADIQ